MPNGELQILKFVGTTSMLLHQDMSKSSKPQHFASKANLELKQMYCDDKKTCKEKRKG